MMQIGNVAAGKVIQDDRGWCVIIVIIVIVIIIVIAIMMIKE